MKSFDLHLNFAGNCEEALRFYETCFGGKIIMLQRFGEMDMASPDEYSDKILHAIFEADGLKFMAADAMPDQTIHGGSNISININFESEAAQAEVYKKLAEGGLEQMPLQDAFWGATFGMVQDKYEINWMLHYDKNPK